jgi:AraC family transcriptional regulator
MEMTTKTLPAFRLAAILHHGPYNQIGPAFRKLGTLAGEAGLFGRATGPMMGIYKDDPRTTRAEELRAAAGIPVAEDTPIPAGLVEERVEGGKYACYLYVGPYEGLPGAWAEVMKSFSASGHQPRKGPSLERYLNDPRTVSPDKLQTEIALPIE